MLDTNYKLTVEMEKAEHTLLIHADGLITKEVLNSCLTLTGKGIALELFLDMENELFLEENPFLLNKCVQLINSGGCIFLISNNAALKFWKCLVDFSSFSYFSAAEGNVVNEGDSIAFQNALLDFERKKQEGKPYLVEKGDIQIKFNVSERLIMSGDSITLTWEVDGADKVIIPGLGKVEAYGRKNIQLKKDTILKIGASNKRQAQIKAILVKVSEANVKIAYDIGFISAGTQQYTSLVNSDLHPHVYGISEGNPVKLTWEVPHAQEVKILPFNIQGMKGEFIFTPSSSITIEIHTSILHSVYVRKIQLLVFPVPLFKEKLRSFEHLKDKKYMLSIPVLLKEKTDQLKVKEKKRYYDLNKKIVDLYLTFGFKNNTLNKLNTFLFTILKEKYSQRKGILKEINSIQSYYERPSPGRGTGKSSL